MKTSSLVASLLAALSAHVGAQQLTAPTVTVGYADLNLRSPAGVAVLDRRIAAAAHSVCPETHATGELARVMIARRCTVLAIEAARAQRDRIVASSAKQVLADSRR
jgi:UrcA family protein